MELEACGVVSDELRHQLAGAGGFRNILVHEYAKIDVSEVAAALPEAPGLFRSFMREVQAWLDTYGDSQE